MCEECDKVLGSIDEEGKFDLQAFTDLLFGVPEATDFLAERGLESEFTLTGSFDDGTGDTWEVRVAQIPAEDVEETNPFGHNQWWVLQAYVNGKLERSTEAAPPEPQTAEQAAEVYAEWHFDYKIED